MRNYLLAAAIFLLGLVAGYFAYQMTHSGSVSEVRTVAKEKKYSDQELTRSEEQTPIVAKADFGKLFSQVLNNEDKRKQLSDLHRLAHKWAQVDAAKAFDKGLELNLPDLKYLYLREVLTHWSEQKPKIALEALLGLDDFDGREQLLAETAKRFALIDPKEALDWLRAGAGQSYWTELKILESLVESDLQAVLDYLQNRSHSHNNDALIAALSSRIVKLSPDQASLLLSQNLNPYSHRVLLESLIRELGKSDPELALNLIADRVVGEQQDDALLILISSLSNRNPVRATEYLGLIGDPQKKSRAAQDITANWIETDLQSALNWAGQMEPKIYHEIIGRVAELQAHSSSNLLDQTLALLQNRAAKNRFMNIVTARFAQRNPRAALDWLQAYAAEPDYDWWLAGALGGWAQREPAAALDYVLEQPRTAANRSLLVTAISNWAGSEPSAAANWAINLTSPDQRRQLINRIMNIWTTQDVMAAGSWAAELAPGPIRDESLVKAVTRLKEQPEYAITLLQRIGADRMRYEAFASIYYWWLNKDRQQALALLDTVSLNASDRERLYRDAQP